MDSISEVKEALTARSRVATLDELRGQGRQRVKVIRPEHIAQMIEEAVQNTVAKSGMISRDEVDVLVAQSRQEFRDVVRERERELEEANQARADVERLTTENAELVARAEAAEAERESLQIRAKAAESEAQARADEAESGFDEVRLLKARIDQLTKERDNTFENVKLLNEERERLEAEVTELTAERDEFREELLQLKDKAPEAAGGSSQMSELGMALITKLMGEVAELKAGMGPAGAAAGGGDPAGAAALSEALERLAGSLDERLDKFGRKMGISSAVDADNVNFDALFKRDGEQKLESNMADIQVKKTQGGGIAANLERLKKLKGGG